jgi:hypothetical protein
MNVNRREETAHDRYARFTKHLEQAGVDRSVAEAQAEAMNRFVVPQRATKPDLEKLEASLTLRMVAIVATLNGLLFALLKLTPSL